MRLDVNIPRLVRPEFGPLPAALQPILRQAEGRCAAVPVGVGIGHIGQGEVVAFCGACCSMMLLQASNLSEEPIDQVYEATHLYDPDWTPEALKESWPAGSSPLGLTETLRDRLPTSFWAGLEITVYEDAVALTRAISWSIAAHGIRPIVLVHKREHWVVVDQCKLTQTPVSASDTGASVCYFYLQDPAFGCDPGYLDKPFHEAVTEKEWRRIYVDLPVPSIRVMPTEKYASKFVMITHGEAVAANDGDVQPVGDEFWDEEDPGSCMFDPISLESFIESEPLFNDDPWSQYRGNTVTPINALKVRDHQNHTHYSCLTSFIPSKSDASRTQIVLLLRERAGEMEFRGAVGTSLDGRLAVGDGELYLIPQDQILSYIEKRYDPFSNPIIIDGVLYAPIPSDQSTPPAPVQPLLFWYPSFESMSPYLPFYEIQVQELDADRQPVRTVTIFLRLDGEAFLAVTPIWPANEVEDEVQPPG